jgi:hypothetical protein
MMGIFRFMRQRGQSMVEFAALAPVMFLMLFGVIEFGWLLFHNHQIATGAREGARFAIVNGEMSGNPTNVNAVRNRVLDRVTVADPDQLLVTLNLVDGDMEPESRIRVEVRYVHQTLVGMMLGVGTVELSSSSTMRMHY